MVASKIKRQKMEEQKELGLIGSWIQRQLNAAQESIILKDGAGLTGTLKASAEAAAKHTGAFLMPGVFMSSIAGIWHTLENFIPLAMETIKIWLSESRQKAFAHYQEGKDIIQKRLEVAAGVPNEEEPDSSSTTGHTLTTDHATAAAVQDYLSELSTPVTNLETLKSSTITLPNGTVINSDICLGKTFDQCVADNTSAGVHTPLPKNDSALSRPLFE